MRHVLGVLVFLAACTGQTDPSNSLLNFLPADVFDGGTDDAADGAALPEISVIHFNGDDQQVIHGPFWQPGTKLANRMRWEAWAQGDPWAGSQYIISDGYGGAHALLWSGINGNMAFVDAANAVHLYEFSAGNYFPPPGVFSHVAITLEPDAWANNFVCVYMNGILTGKNFVPTGYTRQAPNLGGNGILYVGGSDHSNWKGWLAWLRGWESQARIGGGGEGLPGSAFVPDRVFLNYDSAWSTTDFNTSYVERPGTVLFNDVSGGYDSQGGFPSKIQHPGSAYSLQNRATGIATTGYPIPTPEVITTPEVRAPFYPYYVNTAPDRGLVPLTPPAGVKLYDSFRRADQTFAHSTKPDVGTLERSSLGAPPAWLPILPLAIPNPGTPAKLQIFQGTLRLGERAPVFAYAGDSDSSDMDVRVERFGFSTSNEGQIGLGGRMHATFSGTTLTGFTGITAQWQYVPGVDNGTIYVYRWDGANNKTIIGSVALAKTVQWTVLRAVFNGSNVTIYTDGVQRLALTNVTQYQTQTGAGIWFHAASTHLAATSFAVF
jgi:hypothetical protein